MTNHSYLFKTTPQLQKLSNKNDYCILFEGKMIHQYNANYSEARYSIEEDSGRKLLETTELNKLKRKYKLEDEELKKIKLKLDYQDYRLVYRAIASSTNERSII